MDEPVTKNKGGRPKKPIKFKLDLSMDVEVAKEQRIIANAKHDVYKAQLQELKLKQASKDLIDYKIINDITITVFSKLKSILYAGSNCIPAQIVGKNPEETSQIIYDWIDDSLGRFASEFNNRVSNIKIDEDQQVEEEDDNDDLWG